MSELVLGVDTFGDRTADAAGRPLSQAETIRNVVAEGRRSGPAAASTRAGRRRTSVSMSRSPYRWVVVCSVTTGVIGDLDDGKETRMRIDPDRYPPIDPGAPIPDDPGELEPDAPAPLPPPPMEPAPAPEKPDGVPEPA